MMEEAINKNSKKNKKLKEQINKNQKNKVKKEKKYNKLIEDRLLLLKDNIDFQKKLNEYLLLKIDILNQNSRNEYEFYKFRVSHYNKEMEILLSNLDIKMRRISKNENLKMGTKEDYINYIDDNLLKYDKNELEDMYIDTISFKARELVVMQEDCSSEFIKHYYDLTEQETKKVILNLKIEGIISYDEEEIITMDELIKLDDSIYDDI